ncbi:putative peroxidase-related enzyme [Bradyrhizobium sp. LB8.2]|uniref:carboxymuconolactone decarboxylase family protein n=1 Tax=unclassified Bradyrhizobium TaxID=2631580 RepID=UPI003398F43F
MSRMPLVVAAEAKSEAKELLERTQAQLGRVPNLYRAMANSPAALDGYLSFRAALVRGRLDSRLREQLALLIAQANGCEYCVSAHSLRGSKIGIAEAELAANRQAQSDDPRVAAALAFAKTLIETRGRVDDRTLAAVREAHWSDEEITEVVAHVALNLFSNYFNHVAQPALDFPRVEV